MNGSLAEYEEYRRLDNSSRREHRHNGAARFFHEKRDICGAGEPTYHPSFSLLRILPSIRHT